MGNSPVSILYTEDTSHFHKEMVRALGILLDAKVAGFYENYEAQDVFFEGGERFDVYIFDDNTSDSGAGSGTRLAVDIAKKLKDEGRGGLVIAVCASNLAILGLDPSSSFWIQEGEQPLNLRELHENGVEFWFKFTERHKMVFWLSDCLREGRLIPRAEWLRRVGEDERYVTSGRGNELEEQLLLYFHYLTEEDRGIVWGIDSARMFGRIREGISVEEALRENRPGAGKETY